MYQMNEEEFAKIQRECCWFTFPMLENVPDTLPSAKGREEVLWQDDTYVQRYIFGLIFGGLGLKRNLEKAKVMATIRIAMLEKQEPTDRSPANPEFVKWIGLFAKYNVLLGTVFAYLHNYPLAATLLMNGLKTRAINMFAPYCEFIASVVARVEEMPAEEAEYRGCGFSADKPMGGTDLNRGELIASVAELVISSLEGDNGEIVLAHRGAHSYGSITRIGSTSCEGFRNCIDMYEVLVVGKGFKSKKMRLYFNGYFTRDNRAEIRLPKGFHLDPLSRAAEIFFPAE